MAIVCGSDFSPMATQAATAAACLASRQRLTLHVVHALDATESAQAEAVSSAERQLHSLAEQLRKLGADVHVSVRLGTPAAVLQETARQVQARLVVVGAEGQQRGSSRHLGAHAERIAQRCGVSVLVVRDAAPFRAWVQDERALTVMLGAEPSFSTECAVTRIEELRALGPCEVSAVRLFWPPNEFQRLGFSGARSYTEIDPVVLQVLADEVKERHPALASYRLRVEPHLGSLGERLTALAAKDNIDLIVVGSHDRSVVERLWEGSISHATLHNAQTSVLCVPVDECPPQLRRRRAKCVVAATDFSTLGDSALPLAYAITEPGGTLHVVHVVPAHDRAPLDFHDIFALDNLKAPSSARDEALAHLRKLTTSIAKSSDKHIELHVLESNNTAEAIAQAGERLQADVLVLGSHGRTGISKAVMGSVASSLLSSSQRPVMLVRETH